jgi:hypothetical protein
LISDSGARDEVIIDKVHAFIAFRHAWDKVSISLDLTLERVRQTQRIRGLMDRAHDMSVLVSPFAECSG